MFTPLAIVEAPVYPAAVLNLNCRLICYRWKQNIATKLTNQFPHHKSVMLKIVFQDGGSSISVSMQQKKVF